MAEVKEHAIKTTQHGNGRHNGQNGHQESLISAIPAKSEAHTNGHHTNGHHRENGAEHASQRTVEAPSAEAPAATEAEQIVHIRSQIREQSPPPKQKKAEVVITHDLIRKTQQAIVDQLLANRTAAQRQRFTREDATALVNQYLVDREVYEGHIEVDELHIEVAALERMLLRQAQAEAQREWEKNLKIPVIGNLSPESSFQSGNPNSRLDQEVADLRRQRQEEDRRQPRRPEGENTHQRIQEIMNDVIGQVITPELTEQRRYFTRADAHQLIEAYRREGRTVPLDNTLGYMEIDNLQISQKELEDRLFNYVRRAIVQRMAGTTQEAAGAWAQNVRENVRTGTVRAREFATRARAGMEVARQNVREGLTVLRDQVNSDLEVQQATQLTLQTTAEDIISWLGERGWEGMNQELAAQLVDNYVRQHQLTEANGMITIDGVAVKRAALVNQIFTATGDALGRARRAAQEAERAKQPDQPTRMQRLSAWWKGEQPPQRR